MCDVNTKIETIVRKTFNLPSSMDLPALFQMGDIKEWDSLGNFRLLLALEQGFNVRFELHQMESLSSIVGIEAVLVSLINERN